MVLPLILFISCDSDEETVIISTMIGTFEGTVDLGGELPHNTYAKGSENGNLEWDIYLKNDEGQYIERYYWPNLTWEDVSNNPNNWLYGKIESSDLKLLIYTAGAENSGIYTSEVDSMEFPIGWNHHYSVFEFNEDKTSVVTRNVCVPQELQLANDSLCQGWENWELGSQFVSTRVD